MYNSSKATKVAFYGVVSALMFVFLLTETYGLSGLMGNFTPAILTLPFAISISIVGGKKECLSGGLIFGCCSFFLAVIISNYVFLNPLVSILPRIFIGIVSYFVFLLVSKLTKNAKKEFFSKIFPISLSSAFGILTNSILTIFMMWVFNATEIAAVFSVIISLNFVGEVIGAVILCPIYVNVIRKVVKLR